MHLTLALNGILQHLCLFHDFDSLIRGQWFGAGPPTIKNIQKQSKSKTWTGNCITTFLAYRQI